jgi:hypothetical protein
MPEPSTTPTPHEPPTTPPMEPPEPTRGG